MENGYFSPWKNDENCFQWLENVDEEKELSLTTSIPPVPQIRTPKEPMEFLARSWSLSASDITKAISNKQQQQQQQQQQFVGDKSPNAIIEAAPQQGARPVISISTRRLGSFGRWFNKEISSSGVKKKDRMRVENARAHSAVSIAGLAAALAAVTAAQKSNNSGSKIDLALASATELLASHCLALAESSGADHDRLESVVRSAVDVQTAGDLLTLTAAAATALRGESALKARFPKELKKNAAISPCDRCITERQYPFQHQEQSPPVVGELLQLTQKGVLHWKNVSVYISKRSQVMVKVKSKQAGGAFSKKNKCIVYGICDETSAWPYRKERESSEEVYFGLKTAQGLMEFKCKNKVHKQRWVDGIRDLFCQASCIEATGHTLDFLDVTNSI